MNRIMKNRKIMMRVTIVCAVALAGLFACQKTDNSTPTALLSKNTLKAASLVATSEVFDDVMEIGDETFRLYENLLHGKDTVHHDFTGMCMGHGHHGMGKDPRRGFPGTFWTAVHL